MNDGPHIAVTIAALAVAAATLLWLLVLHVRSRPRRPVTGPAAMDLGPEPPAVVDLLTDDFAVTPASVPATLVDLASRRWLSIEDYGGDVVIRLTGRDRDDPLQPYEQRVLDHLRRLAIDGVVPAAAVTTGPRAASRRWWRGFRREVIADAQARGLCRDRWTTAMLTPIWVGTIAAGGLLWLSDREGGDEATGVGAWLWGATLIALIGLAAWSGTVRARDLQRDTDAGLAAASSWLGIREYMATIGNFEDKPAAMVAIWDRYLAHAVALDLAPLVVAQLPLGAEDHRHAWSRETGRWRQVRVRYPFARPGYGQHPLLALVTAVLAIVVGVAVVRFAVRIRRDEVDLVADLPGRAPDVVGTVAMLVGALALALIAWNAAKLLLAVGDVFRTEQHVGVVVRRRLRHGWVGLRDEPVRSSDTTAKQRFFCALDTGARDDVRAWRVRSSVFDAVRQGERYAVRVTPGLGYVRGVDPVAR